METTAAHSTTFTTCYHVFTDNNCGADVDWKRVQPHQGLQQGRVRCVLPVFRP
jgi:hypothetical protein